MAVRGLPIVGGMVGDSLAARPLTEPAAGRLPPSTPKRAEILDLHAESVAGRRAGYVDPASGLFVLSAWFLAERGSCCTRGCRHCPYVEEEPR